MAGSDDFAAPETWSKAARKVKNDGNAEVKSGIGSKAAKRTRELTTGEHMRSGCKASLRGFGSIG